MPSETHSFLQRTLGFRLNSCNNPSIGSWVSGAGDRIRSYTNSVTHGGNYPDWKSRLKTGRQCTTTLNGVLYTIERRDGDMFVTLNGTGCATSAARINRYKGDIIMSNLVVPTYSSAALTDADNEAKRGMVQQIKATFQAGTFLGELGQTVRMLRDPAMALRKGVDDYVREARRLKGLYNRTKPLQRAIAGTYLGFAYGWKPLIADIEDAAKALDRLSKENRSRRRVRSSGSGYRSSLVGGLDYALQNVRVGHYREHVYHASVNYHGVVQMDPGKRLLMAQRLFGFTPEEFVPTVWNLIPYSFLADYFTNIGDIIDAWSYGRGNLRWCAKTTVENEQVVFTRNMTHIGIGYTTAISFASYPRYCQNTRRVFRTAYDGNFIPSFAWELPGIGSSRWTNVAALALAKL